MLDGQEVVLAQTEVMVDLLQSGVPSEVVWRLIQDNLASMCEQRMITSNGRGYLEDRLMFIYRELIK